LIQEHLLDVNVLIALTEPAHVHHREAQEWFHSVREGAWAVCPLTEAGFVRITTNVAFRPESRSLGQATAILQMLKVYPGYTYWPIDKDWATLTAPFAARISGSQQVTDAYLLGLAMENEGALVTFDKGIRYMAGPQFHANVLVIG
jgi:toxin-antitoxin system PIN domain toxin